MTPTQTLTKHRIHRRIRELGAGFHNLDVPGVQPAHGLGNHPKIKWPQFADAVPGVGFHVVDRPEEEIYICRKRP